MMKGLILAMALALAACGPTKKQLKAERDSAEAARVACAEENEGYRAEIEAKNERLARFNQMEKDGTLRPLRIWKGDVSKPVTGTESWQK